MRHYPLEFSAGPAYSSYPCLSGGERQRVGIARAVCRNAPILLLDEATSALDSATEQAVMGRLMAERRADRTTIIVAHRISTLKEADKIVVFDRGRLVEQGRLPGACRRPRLTLRHDVHDANDVTICVSTSRPTIPTV
jgi:ABC-type bacteriocin/lantibiotic exporter with double-glycine peptidase domain